MCDNGHRVCRLAFEKILRINKNKLTLLKRKQLSHGTVTSCGRGQNSTSRQVLEAINWIESFASVHGDRMPDSNKVMLPYRTEKYCLFRRYREESIDSVSRMTFYIVWRDHFSHLKAKAVSLFSSCMNKIMIHLWPIYIFSSHLFKTCMHQNTCTPQICCNKKQSGRDWCEHFYLLISGILKYLGFKNFM